MAGGIPSAVSYWLIALWAAGIIVLAFLIVYGVRRAGWLRGGERERLDRNTRATQQREDESDTMSAARAPGVGRKGDVP
jgi:hypothetical protein